MIADLPAALPEAVAPVAARGRRASADGGQGGGEEPEADAPPRRSVSAAPVAAGDGAGAARPRPAGLDDAALAAHPREGGAALLVRAARADHSLEALLAALGERRERLAATPSICAGRRLGHLDLRLPPLALHRARASSTRASTSRRQPGTRVRRHGRGRVVFAGVRGPLGRDRDRRPRPRLPHDLRPRVGAASCTPASRSSAASDSRRRRAARAAARARTSTTRSGQRPRRRPGGLHSRLSRPLAAATAAVSRDCPAGSPPVHSRDPPWGRESVPGAQPCRMESFPDVERPAQDLRHQERPRAEAHRPARRARSTSWSPRTRRSRTPRCAPRPRSSASASRTASRSTTLLPETFATVREAMKRTLGKRALRRAADRRHRPPRGQDRRDEDRRGQDLRRRAAGLPERADRAAACTSSP